jgi:hypothetical protein
VHMNASCSDGSYLPRLALRISNNSVITLTPYGHPVVGWALPDRQSFHRLLRVPFYVARRGRLSSARFTTFEFHHHVRGGRLFLSATLTSLPQVRRFGLAKTKQHHSLRCNELKIMLFSHVVLYLKVTRYTISRRTNR